MTMNFEELLQRIMESDANVRHCLVADTKGSIITINHREGVTNYLSEQETAASLKRAASAWKARKQIAHKIGNGLYAVAAFEKITRITVPLGANYLLFVRLGSEEMRTDLEAGGQRQIIEHVLNILDRDPTTA